MFDNLQLSEALVIALITLVASSLGYLFNYFSSRQNSKSQMQQVVVKEYLNRRLDIYLSVFRTHEDMIHSIIPIDEKAKFDSAVLDACLVASEDTAAKLLQLREVALDPNHKDYERERMAALRAMRDDLTHFETPLITSTSRFKEMTKHIFKKIRLYSK